MVLTRRARAVIEAKASTAAAAAAAAAAATDPTAAAARESGDSSPRDAAGTPEKTGANLTKNSPEPSSSTIETRRGEDDSNALRASISWRLRIGHVSAVLAVSTLAHAAFKPPRTALPLHALVLLMCALPLRGALAFSAHSVRVPTVRSGMVLALSASVLFASNSLHVLGTRASPSRLLTLIACAALDICAAWLRMTVCARTPSTEPFTLALSFVYSAADIFLAGVVADVPALVALFSPFLGLRFVANLWVLVASARIIVAREESGNKGKR